MNNKIVLCIGVLLIGVSLIKSGNINLPWNNAPRPIDVLELAAPSDETLLKEATEVKDLVKAMMPKDEAKRLRDLYLDMKTLISLDGEAEVIKSTEQIRQANGLAGFMLRMDIKGKYPNLAKECKDIVVSAIGDDNILLSPDLKNKALDSFDALAWAFNEGSK